jgi:quinoprotein glucose dehydrogenase
MLWWCPLAALLASCSSSRDWPSYLGGPDSSQHSTLGQIHRGNVHRLEVAWIYRTGDADPENRSQIQCNPIVVDGVLYGTSASLKLFALDAATGSRLWEFEPFEGGVSLLGLGVNRGVTYWRDGSDRRILYSAGSKLFAVDAEDGTLVESFGEGGSVDLHVGLGDEAADLFVTSNTPGVIYKDLLILGHRAAESLPSAPGHVRAFDVRTGELLWVFHTIPRPGELGYDTWPKDAWKRSGGANAWAGMSVDHARGIVYVPTGSAAYDFFGGDRHGQNLFANTVLALDAATGARVWHYQVVRHDVWDRDLPAPPNLVTLRIDGQRRDAVAQITKSGHVFVLDRDTGEPLFPVEEVPVEPSDLEGEATWPTQPLPTRPPPFARQVLTEDDLHDADPEKHARALERLRRLRPSRPFTPPSREGTVVFPGFDGGGEWGGAAFDPETGLLYVNASEMPWVLTMVPIAPPESRTYADYGRFVYGAHCLYCHGPEREGDPLGVYPSLLDLGERFREEELRALLREGKGFMPAFAFLTTEEVDRLIAYLFDSKVPVGDEPPEDTALLFYGARGRTLPPFTSTGYHRFVDEDGNPVVEPPWGTLTAIDLNAVDGGEIRWQVTLGAPATGSENYGGPVVTAGGLVFIAATKDEKFRAFDKETGEMLWETALPAGGYATPATYEVAGRQFVVIAAGGGKMGTKSGDAYVAFALPRASGLAHEPAELVTRRVGAPPEPGVAIPIKENARGKRSESGNRRVGEGHHRSVSGENDFHRNGKAQVASAEPHAGAKEPEVAGDLLDALDGVALLGKTASHGAVGGERAFQGSSRHHSDERLFSRPRVVGELSIGGGAIAEEGAHAKDDRRDCEYEQRLENLASHGNVILQSSARTQEPRPAASGERRAYRLSSAAFTRALVKGTSRIRAPVASKMALPMAAAARVMVVSPAPIASTPRRSMSTVSTSGRSKPRGMLWYVPQSTDVTFSVSQVTSSRSARLTPWSVPPSTWFLSPSGFEIGPQSTPATRRFTETAPVSRFTSTCAASAQ